MQTKSDTIPPIKPLKELNLSDDFLFDVATIDLETCKDIIEISLDIRIKEIHWREGQKVIHNLPGKRGVRMDFYVEDMDGKIFNVEMQKKNEGHLPKRTRFYQALLDAPILEKGERGFDHLNPTYIIVICCFDPFGEGLYKYTFENRCIENGHLILGDEMKKIFLNTKGNNDKAVPKVLVDFLHYVECSQKETLDDMTDERLIRMHEKIAKIKSNEQMEVSYMKTEERERLIREEGERIGIEKGERIGIEKGERIGREQGERIGIEKGERNKLQQIIQRMAQQGKTAEEISSLLGEDLITVRELL